MKPCRSTTCLVHANISTLSSAFLRYTHVFLVSTICSMSIKFTLYNICVKWTLVRLGKRQKLLAQCEYCNRIDLNKNYQLSHISYHCDGSLEELLEEKRSQSHIYLCDALSLNLRSVKSSGAVRSSFPDSYLGVRWTGSSAGRRMPWWPSPITSYQSLRSQAHRNRSSSWFTSWAAFTTESPRAVSTTSKGFASHISLLYIGTCQTATWSHRKV